MRKPRSNGALARASTIGTQATFNVNHPWPYALLAAHPPWPLFNLGKLPPYYLNAAAATESSHA